MLVTLLTRSLLLCCVWLVLLQGNRAGVVGCGFWNNECGGLDTALMWQIAYGIIAILLVVVLPFLIYYYEHDDEGMGAVERAQAAQAAGAGETRKCARMCDMRNCRASCMAATCYTAVTVALAGLVIGLCYGFVSTASLPYKGTAVPVDSPAWGAVSTPLAQSCGIGAAVLCPCGGGGSNGQCDFADGTLDMDVTFVVYLAALLTFVGWFFFSIYAGIGLIALPLDCFNAFIYRPKLLNTGEARHQKKVLSSRAAELIKLGETMSAHRMEELESLLGASKSEKRKRARLHDGEVQRLKALVDQLERDLEAFQLSDPTSFRQHYNPLVPYFKLVAGILSVVLTLSWIIHIIIFMLFNPPLHPLLNDVLTAADRVFPLFGTLAVAVLAMYMLLAAAKGAFKFGTRFFLIKVHTMEPGKTLINSFLFNCGLILLCVLPTVQFCTDAFSQYVRLTDADVLFGSQFKYLQGFRYFWQYNVFLFTMLAFVLLSAIYFSIWPSDRAHLNRVMARIKSDKGAERRAAERKLAQHGGALQGIQLVTVK